MIKISKAGRIGIFVLSIVSVLAGNQYKALADINPTTNITANRMSGTDRFGTAVAISKQGWNTADNVILVNAYNFPDALSGVSLAYDKNAPILLTDKNFIPQVTKDEIVRLGAKNIYILGGSGAVSSQVEDELISENYKVQRLWGADRFETATKIGDEIMKDNPNNSTAILATAYNFPDALAISSYAAMKHYPVLFTDTNVYNDKTKDFFSKWGIKNVIIPGGTGAISPQVEDTVWNSGISETRIDGMDRYSTALNIVKQYKSEFKNDVMIATGEDFPDALAGGVLAAKKQIPILLVNKASVSEDVGGFIRRKGNVNLFMLGGSGVVSDNITTAINQPPVRGSEYGNLVNDGIAAEENGWIYYYYFDSSQYGIYKMKPDGSSKTKLLKVQASQLNVRDGWIYYCNFDDHSWLYKVRIDGTQNQRLKQVEFPAPPVTSIDVVGNYLYYNSKVGNGLTKVQKDGSSYNKTDWEITSRVPMEPQEMNIVGDWIYYTEGYDNNKLYRGSLDMSTKEQLTDYEVQFINVVGDIVYYANVGDGNKIYMTNTKTGQSTLICSDKASGLNVADGWIYYKNSNDGDKLYKVKIDGTGKTKLTDFTVYDINVTSKWLIYSANTKINIVAR